MAIQQLELESLTINTKIDNALLTSMTYLLPQK